jgi:hypothetical protein
MKLKRLREVRRKSAVAAVRAGWIGADIPLEVVSTME